MHASSHKQGNRFRRIFDIISRIVRIPLFHQSKPMETIKNNRNQNTPCRADNWEWMTGRLLCKALRFFGIFTNFPYRIKSFFTDCILVQVAKRGERPLTLRNAFLLSAIKKADISQQLTAGKVHAFQLPKNLDDIRP